MRINGVLRACCQKLVRDYAVVGGDHSGALTFFRSQDLIGTWTTSGKERIHRPSGFRRTPPKWKCRKAGEHKKMEESRVHLCACCTGAGRSCWKTRLCGVQPPGVGYRFLSIAGRRVYERLEN